MTLSTMAVVLFVALVDAELAPLAGKDEWSDVGASGVF